MKIISVIVLIALVYLNYRHLNIGFLSLYSIDEYAFHGSLLNMYDGLVSLDIKKLFSFGFYSYGFGFFFLNLLATVPFFATDNIEMTIYMPRIITSLFAVGSVWFVYKIARVYVDRYSSVLIALLIFTMPGFYRNALWFHPDWMMTFFVVLSVYLFVKDNFKYKKFFWWAVVTLGFAISTKIQAITFLPFVFVYIFYESFQKKSFINIKIGLKLFAKSFVSLVAIFVITNPYLIHPSGLKVFVAMFLANMESNATNHGKVGTVTIGEKLSNAINFYYLESFLFIILILISLVVLFSIFYKNKSKSILPLIALYIVLNIGYLFLMVNKDWQHYYLTIFTLTPLLLIYLRDKFPKYKYFFLIGVLVVQVSTHIDEYKYVFTKGFHSKEISKSKQDDISHSLIAILSPVVDKDTNILISSYQPFDFRILGLNYKNIHGIYGPIALHSIKLDAYLEKSNSKDPSKFVEKDFIVLSKEDIYFDEQKLSKMVDKEGFLKAEQIIYNFNQGGNLGYEKYAENEYFYVWRRK
ncbi:ArnT family glycosyltransferase [Poseidonibacter ostreae]|uniref:Glycosyltransferase RgtA/B/C/D-like domain-containing protein n=1 Tax=Poseidonibacter ostreae TaxID=2654171 RepID=A0ABQ6VPM7_9BACT|nr:glycosyltransferase family 39 protein [Poseidonibacter ostreae]KAB7892659.1 hypothetical protein GBG18_02035 [Poseidonibacter ostreae]